MGTEPPPQPGSELKTSGNCSPSSERPAFAIDLFVFELGLACSSLFDRIRTNHAFKTIDMKGKQCVRLNVQNQINSIRLEYSPYKT